MMVGYFDSAEQEEPTFDPGMDVPCPVCHKILRGQPVVTPSLLLWDYDSTKGDRSYFYRVHKACYQGLSEQAITALDSIIIDAAAAGKNVN